MAAVHLLRAPASTRVVLVDRSGRFGPGLAYSTRHHEHVLNVPAGRMSAFADQPAHFVDWLRNREPAAAGAFVSRASYGHYLASMLEEAERAAPGRLQRIEGEACAMRLAEESIEVSISTGPATLNIEARHAVLAPGNFPPADPPIADPAFFSSPRYHRDPWRFLDAPPEDHLNTPDSPVLLIGTGLTMVDVALSLMTMGHAGPIVAVSRRGLLPAPHRPDAPNHHPKPPPNLDSWPRTALGLLRSIRREIDRAEAEGRNWREVITSLRSRTVDMWRSLNHRERARFLHRLRPFWDVARHRAAPAPWALIESLMRSGQLTVRAGRLASMRDLGPLAEVTIRTRAGGEELLRPGHVVNCTGPDTRCEVADPFVASLVRQGMVTPDPFGLGLRCAAGGRLIARDGSTHRRLWLVGPLRRADDWEATAIPELRVHAAETAALILNASR